MADAPKLKDPWLVATWPGMGGVGINAAGFLIETLGMNLTGEFAAQEIFEIQHVEVKAGIAQPGRLPRSMIFEWKDPEERRDLLVFVGEAQPPAGGWSLCRKLAEYATQRDVKRLFTFAAMATQLHPASEPEVVGVVTQGDDLAMLTSHGAEVLKDGQVSGMNGVMLAAASEQGLPAMCLLGELPFFAVGVANPRASLAVLEVFASMTGIPFELDSLRQKADDAEGGLVKLYEQLKESASQQGVGEPEELGGAEPGEHEPPTIDESTEHRIEELFEIVQNDRSKAFDLKAYLDRHGVYERYEDRFLDLFKKAD